MGNPQLGGSRTVRSGCFQGGLAAGSKHAEVEKLDVRFRKIPVL